MKRALRHLVVGLLLSGLVCSGALAQWWPWWNQNVSGPPVPISFVSTTGVCALAQSRSTFVTTLPFVAHTGNTMVALVGTSDTGNRGASISDTAGNTFKLIAVFQSPTYPIGTGYLYIATNIVGNAADQVTGSYPLVAGSAALGVITMQFAGNPVPSIPDAVTSGMNEFKKSISSPGISTTVPNELIIGVEMEPGSPDSLGAGAFFSQGPYCWVPGNPPGVNIGLMYQIANTQLNLENASFGTSIGARLGIMVVGLHQ